MFPVIEKIAEYRKKDVLTTAFIIAVQNNNAPVL